MPSRRPLFAVISVVCKVGGGGEGRGQGMQNYC